MEEKINIDSQPLVSIIVITYNSAKYVLETLESAKTQTYENIELIISDDGSKDDTVQMCKDWLGENKKRFVRTELVTVEKNTGTSANCNRGLYASQGEWLKLIAGDDILCSNYLEEVFNFLKYNSEILIVHTDVFPFSNNKEIDLSYTYTSLNRLLFNDIDSSSRLQFNALLRFNPIFAPSVIINKNVFQNCGNFDESFCLWEDRPMWIKFTKKGFKFYYLDKKLVWYRISSNSITNAKNRFNKFEIYRDQIFLKNFIKLIPWPERIFHKKYINLKKEIFDMDLNNLLVPNRYLYFLSIYKYILEKIFIRNFKISKKYRRFFI